MKIGQGKLSRRKLLGGAAAAGAALPALHQAIPHQGLHSAVDDAFAQDGHGGGHDVHGGGGVVKHPLHAADPFYDRLSPMYLADYRRGWQAWGIDIYRKYPRMHWLHILQLASNFELALQLTSGMGLALKAAKGRLS